MDVQIDGELIRLERQKRAWSQEHLASAAGLGVRTVQRIEATGVASYESVRALSAVLGIQVDAMRTDDDTADARPSAAREPLPKRLRYAGRWVGAALALAIFAGASGFMLLKDYQKVRVLRTLEHWVTSDIETSAAN